MKTLEMLEIEIEDLQKQFNLLSSLKSEIAALTERVAALENSESTED